jgi:hypothetical protein
MQPFGYERPTHHLILTDNIHSDTHAEHRKLSSLTLYINLWQEGKPAPGQNPPVISPPVVIFRRIGVCAEIRTQSPVLSNTRLVKMVPLSHLRRQRPFATHCRGGGESASPLYTLPRGYKSPTLDCVCVFGGGGGEAR